jgi:hypothetical protein
MAEERNRRQIRAEDKMEGKYKGHDGQKGKRGACNST